MQATSTDKKTFHLTANEQLLGELIYGNMFNLKAEIRLPKSEVYEIKPVGFFGTSISVTKQGGEIANLKMNWKGQIIFTFKEGVEYVLKATGMFNSKFIIENKEGQHLLLFDPRFNWRKFNYNYEISYEDKPQDILLVLMGVYAANYYMAMMAGVV